MSVNAKTCRRMLEEAASRNDAVELLWPEPTGEVNHEAEAEAPPVSSKSRVLKMTDQTVLVERPAGLRLPQLVRRDTPLSMILTRKAERWKFDTWVLGHALFQLNARRRVPALKLGCPTTAERFQRRNFYRASTVGLGVGPVEMWPVLDLDSCLAAEQANRRLHEGEGDSEADPGLIDGPDPALGMNFRANLVNVSGGGLAALVSTRLADLFDEHTLFWVEMRLPQIDHPLVAVARTVHLQSNRGQPIQVGMAFDFSHDPSHRRFIEERICHFAAWQQRQQLQRATAQAR